MILKRTMSSAHPLHQMLKYHCRDVTVPNTLGTEKLVEEGGFVDQLFAFGSEGINHLLADAHRLITWNITDFRNEIKVCDASVSFSIFEAKNIQNILVNTFLSLRDMEISSH